MTAPSPPEVTRWYRSESEKTEIMFVGYKVYKMDIEPDMNTVKVILQLPQSTCMEVLRLMGVANYLTKFMPQLATVSMPLTAMQKEKNRYGQSPRRQLYRW